MKIKNGFAKRNIAGSSIVVPIGRTADDFNGMITLNDSGAFFWDCLKSDTTVDEIVEKTLGEYDVDAERARADIEGFIRLLDENGLLEK